MKITTLIENKSGNIEDFEVEHGLSIYIEIDGKRILFDTGKSGNFIDNADKLNINLKKLDYVIISHGHYDHSGGFERLIKQINPKVNLYVGNGFFNKKYSLRETGAYEYIGNSFDECFLEDNDIPIEYIKDDIINITENLFIFTNFNKNKEFENVNETMYLYEDGKYKKDMFEDEISLGIKTDKGIVVIAGCSHPGIINILETVIQRTNDNVYALIGGTHLVEEDDEKINRVIGYLKEKQLKILGACHCTGKQGEMMFSQQMEEVFTKNNTGDIIMI